jgi:transcriptional regulator with XRE-family HTH domain
LVLILEVAMMTGPLCKAARVLVEVSRAKLATAANVDERVIEAFERGIDTPDGVTIAALQAALEELGAVLIPEEGSQGVGVRLKFNQSITRRLGTLENEGGLTGKDDVP